MPVTTNKVHCALTGGVPIILRALMLLPGIVLLVLLAAVMSGCGFTLPENSAPRSMALPPAEKSPLGRAVSEMEAVHHPELSGVVPLANGADAFAARMLLTDLATTSIDTQYYIWRADLTGYLLLDRLMQAANRGVRVRLLLDDHGTAGLDPEIASLAAHPNIEVRLWNPFPLRRFKILSFSYDFFRLNRRMHNKSFTVDGRACILGGRNVGDEYFNTGMTPLFVDLDILVVGQVVPAISEDFDRYWNSPSAYLAGQIVAHTKRSDPIGARLDLFRNTQQMEEYRGVLERSSLIGSLLDGTLDMEWATAVLVSDDPEKGQGAIPQEDLLGGRLAEAVGEINTRLDGVSPYFVPGKEGVKIFTDLEARGVAVRILTNSLEATDVLPVHAGYAKRRASLLKGGVELFELQPQALTDATKHKLGPFGSSGSSLHAKTFAVDGQRIFVGSFNFDPRSATLNTEMGVLIDSAQLASNLHQAFDNDFMGAAWRVEKRNGKLVWIEPDTPPLTAEPGASLWRKIALKFIGWLPVEWLL